jgi:hypothetical protein
VKVGFEAADPAEFPQRAFPAAKSERKPTFSLDGKVVIIKALRRC